MEGNIQFKLEGYQQGMLLADVILHLLNDAAGKDQTLHYQRFYELTKRPT